MLQLEGIDHVALTVRDVAESAAWYQRLFGLERRHAEVWGDVPTMIYAGNTALALFPAASEKPLPPPDRNTISMRHLAFRVDRENFGRAQEALLMHGIEFRFEDHIISHSIYFSDPDGHALEITTYELE